MVGKEQSILKFFHLKCKAISPTNLSLYVEGIKLSSTLNAQLSFHVNPSPHGMRLTFLFTSKCIAKLYLSPRILPHLGKDLSFLPPNTLMYMWLSLTTWGRSQAFFLKVHPFPASPQNAMLPFPTNPLPSICREGFFPLQNAKPHKSFSTNSFLYLYVSFYFYLSILLLWIFFSFFFSQKLEILPQSWKIIPQHLGRIIEE